MTTEKHLVVVSDSGCGKTSLLIAFSKWQVLEEHMPTVFENHVVDIQINEKKNIELHLLEVAGLEKYPSFIQLN